MSLDVYMRKLKHFILQYLFGYIQELIFFIKSSVKKGTRKKIKFVIFARGRSGSTLLLSLLNSDPKVNCEGEILNHRVLSPDKLINRRCSLASKEIYGFKLLSYQLRTVQKINDPHTFLRELNLKGFKIIYLRRENLLRHALSKAYANHTNRWHAKSIVSNLPKMKIDVHQLFQSIQESERLEKFETDVLKGIPHFSMTYERNLENPDTHLETVRKIADFLEIQLSSPVTSFVKLSSNDFEDFIENSSQMIEFLKKTQYSEFLDNVRYNSGPLP